MYLFMECEVAGRVFTLEVVHLFCVCVVTRGRERERVKRVREREREGEGGRRREKEGEGRGENGTSRGTCISIHITIILSCVYCKSQDVTHAKSSTLEVMDDRWSSLLGFSGLASSL